MGLISKSSILHQTEQGFSYNNKQVSAIVRIEQDDGITTLFCSPVNFVPKSNGEYILYVYQESVSLIEYTLGSVPSSFNITLSESFDINKEYCVGIFFISNNLPLSVAYSNCGNPFKISTITKAVSDRLIEKQKLSPISETKIKDNDLKSINDIYNDEAVATENFYATDSNLKEKLKAVEELQNELCKHKDFGRDCPIQEVPNKDNVETEKQFNEENPPSSQRDNKEPYFLKVKDELTAIFNKFPHEERLERNYYKSQFAKIPYSENKFYIVGVMYQAGIEKYICYGVPANKNNPPKELEGYASFIPLSVFNLNGDGYYMMFQDALTGECIKK